MTKSTINALGRTIESEKKGLLKNRTLIQKGDFSKTNEHFSRANEATSDIIEIARRDLLKIIPFMEETADEMEKNFLK